MRLLLAALLVYPTNHRASLVPRHGSFLRGTLNTVDQRVGFRCSKSMPHKNRTAILFVWLAQKLQGKPRERHPSSGRTSQYNRPMVTTQAACCLISTKPGVGHPTNYTERFSEPVKCAHCDAEYRLEYAGGEIKRIGNYESRLRAETQRKVNADHLTNAVSIVGHTPIISVM